MKPNIKTNTKKESDSKLQRCAELLDNLVRAVESADQNSMVQASGAGREFLDTNGNR